MWTENVASLPDVMGECDVSARPGTVVQIPHGLITTATSRRVDRGTLPFPVKFDFPFLGWFALQLLIFSLGHHSQDSVHG